MTTTNHPYRESNEFINDVDGHRNKTAFERYDEIANSLEKTHRFPENLNQEECRFAAQWLIYIKLCKISNTPIDHTIIPKEIDDKIDDLLPLAESKEADTVYKELKNEINFNIDPDFLRWSNTIDNWIESVLDERGVI